MVGAGKSTLRDILTYWYVTRDTGRKRRVTIVVGDVAETLAVVETFSRLGVAAAPVLGQTTRERNIQRLHRRLATAGAPAMIAHEHPGFRYLSSACAVDSLRGLEADRPLRIGEAPCTMLFRRTARRPGRQPGPRRIGRSPRPAGMPAAEVAVRNARAARCGAAAPATTGRGTSSPPRCGSPPRRAWCTARSRRTRLTPGSATWSWPAG